MNIYQWIIIRKSNTCITGLVKADNKEEAESKVRNSYEKWEYELVINEINISDIPIVLFDTEYNFYFERK